MGVTLWEPRLDHLRVESAEQMQDENAVQLLALESDLVEGNRTAEWDALIGEIQQCQQCDLCESRTQTVPGVGNRNSRVLVVGEAPGADEDRQGEPFVGQAGKLLNEMLFAIGFKREQVFIANILKCRPPNNRDPHKAEIAACQGYLQRQIDLINPEVILSVGRVSAQTLLGSQEPIGHLRGKVHQLENFAAPIVVTYHPAYLLRVPKEKRKSWADLLMAMQVLQGHR